MSKSDSSSFSLAARGRLAVLSAHLTAAAAISPPVLDAQCVSAQVPLPGNLQGTLTVIDERTGKKYQIQVSEHGTVKASDFKKVLLSLLMIYFCSFSVLSVTLKEFFPSFWD